MAAALPIGTSQAELDAIYTSLVAEATVAANQWTLNHTPSIFTPQMAIALGLATGTAPALPTGTSSPEWDEIYSSLTTQGTTFQTNYISTHWPPLFAANLADEIAANPPAPIGDWHQPYKLSDGTVPSAILDFASDKYFDGTSDVSITTLLTGAPVRDSAGLIPPGDTSIQAKGALLTAMATSATGVTFAILTDRGNQRNYQFPTSMGPNANSFMYYGGGDNPQRNACYQSPGAVRLVFSPSDWTGPTFSASGYSTVTPKRTAMLNDQTGQQDDNVYDAFSPVYFGNRITVSNPFVGRIVRMAVYPKRLAATALPTIRALAPFNVARRKALYIPDTGNIKLAGTNLRIERTQPWTMHCNCAEVVADAVNGHVLFTNVINAPYCGYEVWIDGTTAGDGRPGGRVCVRIMQDLLGSPGPQSAIDLYGGVNVVDGNAHMIGVTYDGSSTAAGVKIYIDGVEDTAKTIKINNLAGSIMGNAGQMWIGNQNPNNYGDYMMNFFAFSNIVRNATYMTTYNSYANKPAVDANTSLYFDFSEGTGTTLTDKSANGFNGTITGSTWY